LDESEFEEVVEAGIADVTFSEMPATSRVFAGRDSASACDDASRVLRRRWMVSAAGTMLRLVGRIRTRYAGLGHAARRGVYAVESSGDKRGAAMRFDSRRRERSSANMSLLVEL
jgi:hypothetical protein